MNEPRLPEPPVDRVEGEILVLPTGDVIIGAPTATATVTAPTPGGED